MRSPKQEVEPGKEIPTVEISPMVDFQDSTSVDVREVLKQVKLGEKFGPNELHAILLSMPDINDVGPSDLLFVFERMYYYSLITLNQGFTVERLTSPAETVMVRRTEGPNKLRGGKFIVPEDMVATKFPLSDGWTIIRRYSQIENEDSF